MMKLSLRRTSMRGLVCTIALASTLLFAAAAQASTAYFTYSDTGGNTMSFDLPQSPTPDQAFDLDHFEFDNITVTANGSSSTGNLLFYNNGNSGGFEFTGSFHPNTGGAQLYTGTEATPTFTYGSNYAVFDFGTGETGDLTISASAPGAPGPEIGLGVLPAVAAMAGLAFTRLRRPGLTPKPVA